MERRPRFDLPAVNEYDRELTEIIVRLNHGLQDQKPSSSMTLEDRFQHLYIPGKSGYGKSSLMALIALQDIEQGFGITVLDPKGDTARSEERRVGKECRSR